MSSLPQQYFDDLYHRDPDPWGFTTSAYEAEKYARTVASLERDRYASGLEVGCSIGVLTGLLGTRCDTLLGIDIAEQPLEQARLRNADAPHIRFEKHRFPFELPAGQFDLIVLSEVLYYLDRDALAQAAEASAALALPGADILLVHWLGPTPDYPLTGETAAEGFIAAIAPKANVVAQHREPEYRIDLLRRR